MVAAWDSDAGTLGCIHESSASSYTLPFLCCSGIDGPVRDPLAVSEKAIFVVEYFFAPLMEEDFMAVRGDDLVSKLAMALWMAGLWHWSP